MCAIFKLCLSVQMDFYGTVKFLASLSILFLSLLMVETE